jgi:putative flippase GtrA
MIKILFVKYKKLILYVFFGVATTLINLLAYAVCTRVLNIHLLISTVLSWLISVLFAYITNRKYVFNSNNKTLKSILIECISFISCRLLTGAIDVTIMYVFAGILGYNDFIIKIVSNLFVIVSNYVVSRLFIFKEHD